MEKFIFIINPRAKNGYALKVWQQVKSYLEQNNIHFIYFLTEFPGHATELSKQICQANDEEKSLIAIGGDGTIHEVMNGAVGSSNVKIGFIPAGSGNDFRRGFSLPKEIRSALQLVLDTDKSSTIHVDVGEITSKDSKKRYFINNMGSGFDAWIAKKVNASKMKGLLNRFSLGGLTYAYYVIKELFTYRQAEVKIIIDNKEYYFNKTWFITISNQPFYGGGMKIAPNASVVDGLFDITVVSNLHPLKFLFVFVTVFWGGHLRYREVFTYRGKHIQIYSSNPLTTHADGEFIGHTPVEVSLNHKHTSVITKGLD